MPFAIRSRQVSRALRGYVNEAERELTRGSRQLPKERETNGSRSCQQIYSFLEKVSDQSQATSEMNKILIGTSGWMYKSWERDFYPDGLRSADELHYYAREFCTVEINNSFYKLPSPKTFSNWAAQVPEEFTFAVKASRYLTHIKRLKESEAALENIYNSASHLESKLGPILVQLPPRWHKNLQRLEKFLASARMIEGVRWVIEFRDESWHDSTVYSLLEKYDAALCIADSYKLERHDRLTADFTYFRYHGRTPHDAPNYTAAQLKHEAMKIQTLSAHVDKVFVYFNNDAKGHAVRNAKALRELL